MSSTWLEQTRSALQNLELIDKAIVQELFIKLEQPRESVLTDLKIKNLITHKQDKCLDSLVLLNQTDSFKKIELEIMSGQQHASQTNTTRQPDVWVNFYDRLKEIRQYHRKHNPQVTHSNTVEYIRDNAFSAPFQPPEFSGEEFNGKFIDLNTHHQRFLNLKKIREAFYGGSGSDDVKTDYIWYLQHFDEFNDIPYSIKEQELGQYKRYLQELCSYLREFFQQVQPLTDYSLVEKQINEEFEYRWREGTMRGYQKKNEENVQQDESLYCASCQKYFTNEHTFVHHLAGKKHKQNQKLAQSGIDPALLKQSKAAEQQKQNPNQKEKQDESQKPKNQMENQQGRGDDEQDDQLGDSNDVYESRQRSIAFLENYITRLKEQLCDLIHDTLNNIRKKQSRNYEERQADDVNIIELDEQLVDEQDDQPIYNPKNLPLGFDGKPIPYWLYKLHGLGIEYKCEICGNYSYWGRRAFERHFQQYRHNYGMQCLKIPNTVHFQEITSIQDAIALHQKIIAQSNALQFNPEEEEQFEDTEGNKLNKKLYHDLMRQGLL